MTRGFSILLILFLSAFYTNTQAQTEMNKPHLMEYIVENGDTLYLQNLDQITVFAKSKRKTKRDWKNYSRMVYNLPKVYPYSQIVKTKLSEMDANFLKLKSKSERKKYIKTVEKEMTAQYKSILKGMSMSQGKMLIKLVNRETETTVYKILKETKGGFSAFFWQGVATVFGANLKSTYNKNGDDAMLENLLNIYEHGDYETLYMQVFGMGIEEHAIYMKQKRKKK